MHNYKIKFFNDAGHVIAEIVMKHRKESLAGISQHLASAHWQNFIDEDGTEPEICVNMHRVSRFEIVEV